jgi:hypothetical protein
MIHGTKILPPTQSHSSGRHPSLVLEDKFSHITPRYSCLCSKLSNNRYIYLSYYIVHVGYLVFMCAGTWYPQIDTILSCIKSLLACNHSLLISIAYPIHTLRYFPLRSPHSALQYSHLRCILVLSTDITLPHMSCPITVPSDTLTLMLFSPPRVGSPHSLFIPKN